MTRPCGVAEPVDPGLDRDLPRRGSVRRGVGHALSLARGRPTPPRGRRSRSTVTRRRSPTVTGTALASGCRRPGRRAGRRRRSSTSNLLPWHGQLIVPSCDAADRRSPGAVQIALNALNSPGRRLGDHDLRVGEDRCRRRPGRRRPATGAGGRRRRPCRSSRRGRRRRTRSARLRRRRQPAAPAQHGTARRSRSGARLRDVRASRPPAGLRRPCASRAGVGPVLAAVAPTWRRVAASCRRLRRDRRRPSRSRFVAAPWSAVAARPRCRPLAGASAASPDRGRPSTWRRNSPVWLSGCAGDLLRGALGDDQAAAGAALRAHVDDPVGGLDDVEVVLDDDHRVALVDQALQHPSSLRMSSKCRPVVGSSST